MPELVLDRGRAAQLGSAHISAAIRINRASSRVQQPHRCPRAAADGPPAEEEGRGGVEPRPAPSSVTDTRSRTWRRVPRHHRRWPTRRRRRARSPGAGVVGWRASPAASQRRCAAAPLRRWWGLHGVTTADERHPATPSTTSHVGAPPRLARETGARPTTGPQPRAHLGAPSWHRWLRATQPTRGDCVSSAACRTGSHQSTPRARATRPTMAPMADACVAARPQAHRGAARGGERPSARLRAPSAAPLVPVVVALPPERAAKDAAGMESARRPRG